MTRPARESSTRDAWASWLGHLAQVDSLTELPHRTRFTDRLGETFTNLDLAMFGDVGHFPHREDPDRAASEIAAFCTRIGWC